MICILQKDYLNSHLQCNMIAKTDNTQSEFERLAISIFIDISMELFAEAEAHRVIVAAQRSAGLIKSKI